MTDVHYLTPAELAGMRRRALGLDPVAVHADATDELTIEHSELVPPAIVMTIDTLEAIIGVINRHRLALAIARTRLDNQQARIAALEAVVLPPPTPRESGVR